MLPERVAAAMRSALPLLALALAGCLNLGATTEDLQPAEVPFLPYHAEGMFWVEPSMNELTLVEIPFIVNGTGRTTTAVVTVGERYGPIELPRSTAYLEMEIVDADGDTQAEARRQPGGEPTTTLEAKDLVVGEGMLVLRIGGGSDESANGDYVKWVLDVK